MLRQAHDDVEAAVALEQLAGRFAADGDLDDALHLGNAEAVAGERLAVEPHGEDRQARDLLDLDVTGAADAPDRGLHLFCGALQDVEVVTEDLDADIAAHAGNQLVDTELDRLGDFIGATRNLVSSMIDGLDHLGFRLVRVGPFGARFEHDVAVGLRRRHRVGRDLRGADAGEELLHFGDLLDAVLQGLLQVQRLGEAGAGNPDRRQRDVAFVQARNELATHACGGDAARNHDDHGHDGDRGPVVDGKAEQGR